MKYVPFTKTTRENHYGGYSIEYLFTLVGNAIFNKLISRLDEDIEYSVTTSQMKKWNIILNILFISQNKNNITSMT